MTASRHHGRAPSTLRCALALSGALLAGCLPYREQTVALPALAAALPPAPPRLDFTAAVEFAFAHNPELLALAAQARAAGVDVMPTDAQVQLQDRRLASMIDPLALLGLAQRGAAVALADARAEAAVRELLQARWRTAAALAEVFATQRVLDEQRPPTVLVPSAVFAAAGLASPAAVAEAEAAAANAQAEHAAIAAERAALRAELIALLGAAPGSTPQLTHPPADWPPVREPDTTAIHARPDLALALALYRTADAELRKAVAEQYPSLMVGPDFPLGAGMIEPMAIVRLPLDARGPARAANERREAARLRVAAALLAAHAEVDTAHAAHTAAAQRADATRAAAAATRAKLQVAEAALATEVDAFETFADRAPMAVRDAVEARMAAVAAARARVRLAVACGWPAEGASP